ncbi:MAG: site-specific integrase [Oscillospiraceae bacterium]|nr:site-specific integrase [Oscillospiraceae bacterium]MBR3448396.1 site-specific integrase [Oscillospiraceae bacterium]MBR4199991.1 site-specific integrase [Oscillospiraceae bacterium]
MDMQSVTAIFPGLQIRDFRILAEHTAAENREVCVQLTVLLPAASMQETGNRTKFEAVAAKWLKMKSSVVKSSSYDRLEATVQNQILPFFGQLRLDELDPACVQDWIDELAEAYSYSTLTKAFQSLNAIIDYAVLHDLMPVNNIRDRTVLPRNNGRNLRDVVTFTPAECERIIKASYEKNDCGESEPLAPLLPFLLNTGLRIGEALALRWGDIDRKHRFVRIRKNIKSVRNRSGKADEPHYLTIEQNSVKTRTSDRVVHLNHAAMQALTALRKRPDTDLVFPNRHGAFCSYASIRRMMQRIFRRAQVPVRGFHVFRHTFATNLFAQGVEVKTVSSILGHSSVKITYDIYIHSIQEQEARAVALLAEADGAAAASL